MHAADDRDRAGLAALVTAARNCAIQARKSCFSFTGRLFLVGDLTGASIARL
jgi:hypothetical protein